MNCTRLLKQYVFIVNILLVCSCFLIINCGQQQKLQQQPLPSESTPILKLPSVNSPMASPPHWETSPYDNLGESASTSSWEIKLSESVFSLDLMPTDVRHSWISVTMKLKNRNARTLSFAWEAFLYEGVEQQIYPLNLIAQGKTSQSINRLILRPSRIASWKLVTRQGPAIGPALGKNKDAVMTLVLRITDSEGRSVQVRTPKKRFNVTH